WVSPQKLTIENNMQTLNDLQKLLGTINCVRPWIGISTETLSPVFNLLKGDSTLTSP
ncbi:POK18 protein, partial [Oreotrochilus melanogaster]|nr:POK18 protein [Oreotrochilus melanogaster]